MINYDNQDFHLSSFANPFTEQIPELMQDHLDHLTASAISPEVIKESGYRSVLGKNELLQLGFSKHQCRTPGILIPPWGYNRSGVVGYQFRC